MMHRSSRILKLFIFCLSVLSTCTFCTEAYGQSLNKGKKNTSSNPSSVANEKELTKNIVVDTIYKDPASGAWLRKIKYSNGSETTMILPPPIGERTPINVDTINKDSVVIVVEKEYNVIYVLYKRKRIRQYRAVFGPDKMKDKHKEGDRCTPEGWFRIVSIRDHNAWQKFMLLDYPTPESYDRFNERMKSGVIPGNSKIGGAIGIHGTFKGGDNMVDMGFGWTDGCVALKSTDIYDLFNFVKEGTRVYITKRSKAIQKDKKS